MQFKVPQFLEIEDKIFGPFTFKQFAYLAGGAGMCFVLYKILGLFLSIVPIIILGGFALALTFYKPNNKPFLNMVESFFKYAIQDKLYIWKRRRNKINQKEQKEIPEKSPLASTGGGKLGASKLRDLAWSLDVLDLKKQSGTIENK